MAELLYDWMRNLACYFIFLSAVMHFLPDNGYKKYIQYYMGLLLILLLLSPLLSLFNLDTKVKDSFDSYVQEEELNREEWEAYAGQVEEKYGVESITRQAQDTLEQNNVEQGEGEAP